MLKRTIQTILCCIFIHKWKVHVENIRTEDNKIICIGFADCKHCGASKILFIYGC